MKKKKPFILLELLIGLMIFSLCAPPLIELPVKALSTQLSTMTRMQLFRFGDSAFAKVKEQLYKKELEWSLLKTPKNKKHLLFKDTITVGTQVLDRKCYLFSTVKPDKEGKEHCLVTVEVVFSHPKLKLFFVKNNFKKSQTFHYQVFVEST